MALAAPIFRDPASSLWWRRWLARRLWLAPLLLSLLFTILVVVWARENHRQEQETRDRTIMADALSLEAQLAGRLEAETAHLRAVAARLPLTPAMRHGALGQVAEIAAGLERRWLSVVWLDAQGRIVAEAQRSGPDQALPSPRGQGISLHLVAPVSEPGAASPGQLIARFDPADMIKSKDFWWLASQYDVWLLSGQGEVILSTETPGQPSLGDSHEVAFQAIADAQLRLTQRVRAVHWFSTLPVVLTVGLLGLIAVATVLLRRQMNRLAEAESAWRTEAAWRQSLEESALVGLRARDLDGALLFANRTFCDMVGYSLEQLLHEDPHTDERAESMAHQHYTSSTRNGQVTRWRQRSGRLIDVLAFESPLVDGAGQQVGWMGSFIDITDRRRLEELERRQREVLANHARLTTLGEVASTLAHELNQPLTGIVGYSAGLAKALERTQASAHLQAAARALCEHATLAGDIVHRIRARLGRREPTREWCAPNALCAHAVQLLAQDFERAGVDVRTHWGQDLPPVLVDRVGIEQVLSNLLRNACEATLGAPLEQRRIDVHTGVATRHTEGGEARGVFVRIVDAGPGLEGKDLEQLTAPFYTTKQDGTGLGLAICRSILESHAGTLEAADQPPAGACFTIWLPLRDGEPPNAGPRP